MALAFDLKRVLQGDHSVDNFSAQLIRLFLKADRVNFARLRQAFPNTAKVVETWKYKGIILDNVPDDS